jgi:hypothetical protein
MTDQLAKLEAVIASLNETDQPAATFRAVDETLRATIGHILFTILICHHDTKESERFYTNMPDAYPIGGRKPITDSDWMKRMLGEGKPYIGYDAKDIETVFYDHELIHSLGCDSVLNMPVRWRGTTIATFNLLDRAGAYNDSHIPLARAIAQLALPAVLLIA